MGAFGSIPKLFDRNFAIGYFLPAGLIVGLVALVLHAFHRLPSWLTFDAAAKFIDAAVVAVGTWLLAVLLVAINRTLVRTLEGYTLEDWAPPVFDFLKRRWISRYRGRAEPPLRHQEPVDQARTEGRAPPPTPAGHAAALRKAVERFPDQQAHVLPTGFGNRYRAIEVYPRVVYGLDAIPAWSRLQAVLPKDFTERIAEALAQLNFCINLLLAGVVTLVLYGSLAFGTQSMPAWWLPAIAAAAVVFGYRAAGDALGQYGELVKSAFDLYRGDLAGRLGLELPRAAEQERAMWTEVSRVMIYRSAPAWSRLTRFRKRGGTEL